MTIFFRILIKSDKVKRQESKIQIKKVWLWLDGTVDAHPAAHISVWILHHFDVFVISCPTSVVRQRLIKTQSDEEG